MQIRREVLKMTFHDWSTTWTAIEVSLTNIPYFLSAYWRYDPHRSFGEQQNVCNSRAKGECFTNFSGQNERKTIFNFIWIDDSNSPFTEKNYDDNFWNLNPSRLSPECKVLKGTSLEWLGGEVSWKFFQKID